MPGNMLAQRLVPCFAAGTPVLTPEGEKAIEEVRPGDVVLSRDESDVEAPVGGKVVEECFVREGIILNLHVAGQVIRTTPEHPFFVRDRGWTPAGELRVGDLVATHDGRWLPVEDLFDTGQSETVYNLRVTDYHTYFVGSRECDLGIWAHNSCRLTDEAAARLFPNSTRLEYGEGLSALARQRRAAGGVRPGANVAVIEYVENGVTKTKLFKSVADEFHSEEVAMLWLNKRAIDRSSVTRLYSEFHPCTGCDLLVRAAFPRAQIEFSWPYRSTSLRDPISNAGRAMKGAALRNL